MTDHEEAATHRDASERRADPTRSEVVELPGGARLFRGPGHEPKVFRTGSDREVVLPPTRADTPPPR